MRTLILPVAALLIAWSIGACKSSTKAPTFCDTTCNNDSVKFNYAHPGNPYVYISVKGCKPDTITWSHDQLETKRKMGFYELVGKDVKLNRNYVSCFFKDTSYAWLKFNDCITGRSFLVKLPYSKADKWSIYTSGLNNFDPKYKVADNLIAYYDDTYLYVQNMENGKIEQLLLNDKSLKELDFNKPHDTFDSINVTSNRIWVSLKINGEAKTKEKEIHL